MVTDAKKGDKIRYSYYVYDVQCIADAIVSDVKPDGSCVIDQGDYELVVEPKNIVSRYPREDEIVKPAPIKEESKEDIFNAQNTGIRLQKKEVKQEPTKQEFGKSNKIHNGFGEK